ncbi:translation initiation factor eIF2 assembly protein-like, partial [Saccoglossus kowalevskii]|uniref:Cell division cycle protein 123 homolog n=1 Tax=Saccoglossus kowalevskii TaxID=10224 RepID=A0ABM0MFA3_SACKO
GGILVVDFNAFGEVTDPLLFSWQELISTDDLAVSAPSSDSDAVVPGVSQSGLLRYVKTAVCILPNPVHLHRMPADFIDLSHGNDLNKLVDFLQMDREPPSNAGAN